MENKNETSNQDLNSALHKTDVSGSASRKPNPYQLVYWRSDWSESKTSRNNAKYWEWEIKHNGFRCP